MDDTFISLFQKLIDEKSWNYSQTEIVSSVCKFLENEKSFISEYSFLQKKLVNEITKITHLSKKTALTFELAVMSNILFIHSHPISRESILQLFTSNFPQFRTTEFKIVEYEFRSGVKTNFIFFSIPKGTEIVRFVNENVNEDYSLKKLYYFTLPGTNGDKSLEDNIITSISNFNYDFGRDTHILLFSSVSEINTIYYPHKFLVGSLLQLLSTYRNGKDVFTGGMMDHPNSGSFEKIYTLSTLDNTELIISSTNVRRYLRVDKRWGILQKFIEKSNYFSSSENVATKNNSLNIQLIDDTMNSIGYAFSIKKFIIDNVLVEE